MPRTWWKGLAVVPLLGLTLWWIHSDGQETGVSAAPLAAAGRLASARTLAAAGSAAGGTLAAAYAGPGGGGGLGIGSSPGIDPSTGAPDRAWRWASLWDDGKAEFCAYEVSWAHYGLVYKGRALLVLVKEPWSPAQDVKADHPGRDSFEVLKLNHVRDVATGIYTYHQMASLFWRRDSGALQKIAATSSEACGVSYAEMTRGRLQTHSYFDGQGNAARAYPGDAVPEDGLPAALRDYVAGTPPAILEVFPSLLASRFGELAPRSYHIERRKVPEEAPKAVELRLTSGAAKLTYTFEPELPHRLLRFERDDGTAYRLAKCERIAYWDMHDPGGESWLPPAVR